MELLRRGADPNAKNDREETPLHLAAIRDQAKAIEVLLRPEFKTDVNIKDECHLTPLHMAARKGKAEAVAALCKHPHININAKDSVQGTALIYAAGNNSVEVLKILLEHNADVNIADEKNFTALMHATMKQHKKAMLLLQYKGAQLAAGVRRDESTPTAASATRQNSKESFVNDDSDAVTAAARARRASTIAPTTTTAVKPATVAVAGVKRPLQSQTNSNNKHANARKKRARLEIDGGCSLSSYTPSCLASIAR